MFLHIGNNFMVNTKDIIGIFDIENTSVSKITKDFLNESAKTNRVITCTYEMPKSFIVCMDKDFTEKVYISQMSCATLLKRFHKPVDENNYK